MKTPLKSTFIILLTLGIGIVIGVLGHRAFLRRHFRTIEAIGRHGGMREIMERRIVPSPEQAEDVRRVLDKYDSLFHEMHVRTRDKMRAIMDSLRLELKPLLTPEQLKRVMAGPPARHGPEGPGFGRGGYGRRPFSPQRCIDKMEKLIEPTPEQRDTVRAILAKYAPDGPPGCMLPPPEFHARIDSMKNELKHVLTPEQMNRIDKAGGPPMGPPPHDRPPMEHYEP